MLTLRKKRRLKDPVNLSKVAVDMHSHLLPGIDDGATDLNNSIEMIQKLMAFGYRKFLTTPHIMSDLYKNTTDTVRTKCNELREELTRRNIEVELECSAEYFTDSYFQTLIAKNDLMPFGNNYILFELGFVSKPPMFEQVIYDLQMAGYRPILAHPERYTYMHREFHKFEELVNKGVHLQLNVGSLSGSYGNGVRRTAKKLIDEGLGHILRNRLSPHGPYRNDECHHI